MCAALGAANDGQTAKPTHARIVVTTLLRGWTWIWSVLAACAIVVVGCAFGIWTVPDVVKYARQFGKPKGEPESKG